MYKIAVLITFLCAVGWGCLGVKEKDPYELDYNKIAINLPVTHTKLLSDKTFGLGELYLAEDLKVELEKNGFDVRIFAWEDSYSNRNFKEGVEFFMRAWPELREEEYHGKVDKDRLAVLFETIPYQIEEVKNADLIFTGSLKKDKMYKEMGLNSYFLPQFTRADEFYYSPKDEVKTKLLFVGNVWSREMRRKTVDYAVAHNIDIDIYGKGWGDVIPLHKKYLIKGEQIKNDELKHYYSSADIVFNDTRDDMIASGFISNRIFDVTASKGFVISDYIPEIEEIYGDSIPMYKTEEEFLELIEFYLAHPEIRKEKALKAHEITMKNFTSDEIIKKMATVMSDFIDTKKGDNNE